MSENDTLIRLSIPAKRENALVMRMALSGVGLLAGLDVDTIGDLRTVTGECVDCLLNQPSSPGRIELCAWTKDGRLYCRFTAEERTHGQGAEPMDIEIVRGVLETLMPEVDIQSDECGVNRILCSMPL